MVMFILTKATRFCGDVPSLCIDLGPLVQRLLMNHLTLETLFDQLSRSTSEADNCHVAERLAEYFSNSLGWSDWCGCLATAARLMRQAYVQYHGPTLDVDDLCSQVLLACYSPVVHRLVRLLRHLLAGIFKYLVASATSAITITVQFGRRLWIMTTPDNRFACSPQY
jgi:hypothetical protein